MKNIVEYIVLMARVVLYFIKLQWMNSNVDGIWTYNVKGYD